MARFIFSLAKLKIRCSKIGILGKTSEKVTKDQERVEAACKDREKYMNKLKESIINDAKKGSRDTTKTSSETRGPTTNASNETTSLANNEITIRSNGAYIYSVDTLPVLAIGVCIFFAYKLLRLQTKNKSMKNNINHQNDVICFRYYDEKNLIQ